MTINEQELLRRTCHELRSIRATLQAGFRHIQNPNVDSQKAQSLCEQGLDRLDKILDELEREVEEGSREPLEVQS